jgi:hypothetical protein
MVSALIRYSLTVGIYALGVNVSLTSADRISVLTAERSGYGQRHIQRRMAELSDDGRIEA